MKAVTFPEILAKAARLPANPLEGEGRTTREVIEDICTRHDKLRAHLFYENNSFKEHFLLTSEGGLVDPDSELPLGSQIEIMLATSGGLDLDQLSNEEIKRYVRHITLPGVGREGQLRLKRARVLVIGTGGLGSPICLYLAAAGVGTIGLVDFDIVETSNLQRQVVHGNSTLGMPKVESARRRMQDLNPAIQVNTFTCALDEDNAAELIGQYDMVVDGTDNFSSRYLVNDVCASLSKPMVYGAIHRFEGQMSVFNHGDGPCYRCLFANSPPAELAPNCSAGGVIGVLPGVVGLIQATEVVKLILGIGESLSGRLLRFDALAMRFSEVRFKRRSDCKACSPARAVVAMEDEAGCASIGTAIPTLAEKHYIEPLALKQAMEQTPEEIVVIDVREPNELEVCGLQYSLNIPLADLEERIPELDPDMTHCLVCYAGVRAERAAMTLIGNGFQKVKVMSGGMKRWVREIEPDMPIY